VNSLPNKRALKATTAQNSARDQDLLYQADLYTFCISYESLDIEKLHKVYIFYSAIAF